MSFKSVAEFEALKADDALTTAERKLIKETKAGTACYLFSPENPARPTSATDKTRIRASLLRLLITGGTKDCGLHERGVSLHGGWIEGDLDLLNCKANGQTLLEYCVFGTRPDFEQARLNLLSLDHCSMPGLRMQGVTIVDALFLSHLVSFGTVNLSGAQIGGQVAMIRATLHGTPAKALFGQGINVTHSMLLDGLVAHGMLDLNSAEIGGSLSLREATVCGATVDASKDAKLVDLSSIKIESARIKNGVFLDKLNALGTINTVGSRIDGQLSLVDATLDGNGSDALYAQSMQVAQIFVFQRPNKVVGKINLSMAHANDLADDHSEWLNSENQLVLDGFRYSRLAGAAPTSFKARRLWLAAGSLRDGAFYPQPYTQLARVLRQMGEAGEARKVLMERTSLQAQAIRKSRKIVPNGDISVAFRSLWADVLNFGHSLIDWVAFRVAGYGHAPFRAFFWLIGLFLLATTLANFTWKEGSFAPNSAVILDSPGWAVATARDCFPINPGVCDPNPAQTWANTFTAIAATPTQGADWDSFNRYGYAADLVVPFLDLGQTDAWAPSKDRGDWGWWLWWMRWILSAAGWVVTGLGVAAVTGVMQRNQPD